MGRITALAIEHVNIARREEHIYGVRGCVNMVNGFCAAAYGVGPFDDIIGVYSTRAEAQGIADQICCVNGISPGTQQKALGVLLAEAGWKKLVDGSPCADGDIGVMRMIGDVAMGIRLHGRFQTKTAKGIVDFHASPLVDVWRRG